MLLADSPQPHQHKPYEQWLSGVPLQCCPLQLLSSCGSVPALWSVPGRATQGGGNQKHGNVFLALSAEERETEILMWSNITSDVKSVLFFSLQRKPALCPRMVGSGHWRVDIHLRVGSTDIYYIEDVCGTTCRPLRLVDYSVKLISLGETFLCYFYCCSVLLLVMQYLIGAVCLLWPWSKQLYCIWVARLVLCISGWTGYFSEGRGWDSEKRKKRKAAGVSKIRYLADLAFLHEIDLLLLVLWWWLTVMKRIISLQMIRSQVKCV